VLELQQQLTLLTLPQLGSFRDTQVATENKIRDLIGKGNSELAEIDRQFQEFLGPGKTKLIGNTPVLITDSMTHAPMQLQVVDRKSKVRQAFGLQIRPLQKQMAANVALAKVYQTRHWSKPQVLNRAVAPASNLTDALARRAHYAAMFELAGKAELFSWSQIAIDTADAILADSVYRANAKRSKDERAFLPSTFMALLPNAEYTEATGILQEVLMSAKRAGMAIAQFEQRGSAVSLDLIALGLSAQDAALVDPGLDTDPFDASGAVKESYFLNAGKRVSGR
jgi:hypothetical protein